VLQDIADLIGTQTRVHGYQNAPGVGYGVMRLQELGNIRSEKGHPVVLLEPRVAQPGGKPVYPLLELLVSVTPLPVDDSHLIREHVSVASEEAHRRKLATIHFFLLLLLQNKLPFPKLA